MSTSNFWKTKNEQYELTTSGEGVQYTNPLFILPFEIRQDLTTDYFETGKKSLSQKYFHDLSMENDVVDFMQKIYFYAVKNDDHMLAWNVMVILSQLSYDLLGEKASILALAATRSKYMDVIELGIRCYENWEDKDACIFLNNAQFEEKWLKDYAKEVYSYVMEEGHQGVLFEKNHTWKVAIGGENTTSHISEHRSRYCSG